MSLGIIANLHFAIPALCAPHWFLKVLRLPRSQEVIWLRNAGGLLAFLSFMYCGAAHDPLRYRLNARLAIGARMAFAAFWFWMVVVAKQPRSLLSLAIADAMFGGAQWLAYVKGGDRERPVQQSADEQWM